MRIMVTPSSSRVSARTGMKVIFFPIDAEPSAVVGRIRDAFLLFQQVKRLLKLKEPGLQAGSFNFSQVGGEETSTVPPSAPDCWTQPLRLPDAQATKIMRFF